MPSMAMLFAITLAMFVTAPASGSPLRCISCPCGSGSQNYTHCLNESLSEGFSCERWSHCQACEANITSCITCPEDRSGPTCSENKNIQSKREDDSALVNYRRHRRQSGPEIGCLNHGTISDGRVIVILPVEARSKPLEGEEDFELPFGTRLKYECYEGFRLVGNANTRCESTGFWSEPSVPECRS